MTNVWYITFGPFRLLFGIDTGHWQFSVGCEVSIPEESFSAFVNVGPLMLDFEFNLLGYEEEV